jgi:hypothetical protein
VTNKIEVTPVIKRRFFSPAPKKPSESVTNLREVTPECLFNKMGFNNFTPNDLFKSKIDSLKKKNEQLSDASLKPFNPLYSKSSPLAKDYPELQKLHQNLFQNDKTYANVKNNMTIEKFMGFFQSDGHCTFNLEAKTIHPKMVLTQTKKIAGFLCGVHDWLYETYNITSTLEQSIYVPIKDGEEESAPNLTIDRHAFKKLSAIILASEKKANVPLLFDKKRDSWILTLEAIKIKEEKLTEENAPFITQIKKEIKSINKESHPETLVKEVTDEEFLNKLGYTNYQDYILYNDKIDSIKKANLTLTEESLVLFEKENSSNFVNSPLANFVCGVIEGDGSFISVLHNPTSTSVFITPRLAFTSLLEETSVIFKLLSFALSGKNKTLNNKVGKNKRALTISFTKKDDIQKYVFPLFDKYLFLLEKNAIRYGVFKKVSLTSNETFKDKKKAIELAKYIYKTDLYFLRKNTLEEYIYLIDLKL